MVEINLKAYFLFKTTGTTRHEIEIGHKNQRQLPKIISLPNVVLETAAGQLSRDLLPRIEKKVLGL